MDDRGTMKSVVQYFQETYGFNIQHTTLPCLQVGNQQRPNYLPMEVSVLINFYFLFWLLLSCNIQISCINCDISFVSASRSVWLFNCVSMVTFRSAR